MYPDRVTLGEDGVYRWTYEMDMIRDHTMINLLVKVLGIIFGAICVILLVLLAVNGLLTLPAALWILAEPFIIVLLAILIYRIIARVRGGILPMRYEMNDEAVLYVRDPRTQRVMTSAALITALTGAAAGKAAQGLASGAAIGGAAVSGLTLFREVRRVKERQEQDMIDLVTLSGGNQIRVPGEDYAFVRDHILRRVPEKAIRGR